MSHKILAAVIFLLGLIFTISGLIIVHPGLLYAAFGLFLLRLGVEGIVCEFGLDDD